LPIINKPKHPKKGEYKEQYMKGPTSKKTKEPPKRANPEGNIKFWQPLMRSISNTRRQKNHLRGQTSKGTSSSANPSREAYQIRKGGGAAAARSVIF
jgi:hypothetical protein